MDSQYYIKDMRISLSVLSLAIAVAFSTPLMVSAKEGGASTDDIEFDTQTVKARGVDPALAQWFNKAPRFLPGTTVVALSVNGAQKSKLEVHFDKHGNFCPDKAFFKAAGLITPSGFEKNPDCFDLKTSWPQAELNLDPGENKIDLVVPADALTVAGQDASQYEHGGVAGMLNYDAQYMGSSGSSSGTEFEQLDTEAGFNAKDWIFRSRESLSRLNGETSVRHQAAYTQHTFDEMKKVLQAGQVSLANSMFSTGQVLGMQMFPDTALQNSKSGAAVVDGIADTQSVVEVRQSGVLVYSTTVPAGPFHLQNFPLLNTRSDLSIKLTGNNGEVRQFTVPAAAFLANGAAVASGLSFGAGKLDQEGSTKSPMLATVGTGWALTPRTVLNVGILGSSVYRAGAASLGMQPFNATQLNIQSSFAQDSEHGDKGISTSVNVNHQLTERVSANVNMTQQTSGYQEFSDAIQSDDQDSGGRTHNQYGAGISWAVEDIGTPSLSWARSTTFQGQSTTYVRGGWSKQIGRAYLSASLEHNSGTDSMDADDRLYVNMSIPFGNRSVSSYYTHANTGTRYGGRYSDRSSQDRGWSLAADRDEEGQNTNLTSTMDMVTPVSQLSGSISRDSNNFTSWSGHSSGSVVAHNHGVTLSPYHVGDTFGIAKVGNEGGIRLDTPSGPTWTDSKGYAVLPTLNGYRSSAIQVDTRSLDKNVDINNAWQETSLARGAVGYINFSVMHTRRVLVTLTDAHGQPALHGASVFNKEGEFITVVGDKGKTFIPDSKPGMQFDVQASGKTICTFTLSLPEDADTSGIFEVANAKCS
ncbi:fimbria/pilus outer membrane usher protein [Buttiauxella agrestis]|uniref:Beta-fimbriae usher protein n=1 Tax=Buttiauxella agrestis ATCC 33320 TaxID=1006004 RepID=A0A085FYX6_9ENTR|nr:fimbria/pilus outer membrane usher protein [Buttiauxella agrestis]KFC76671.1 beta-fimbriae usher protein [Buttiauxella agrestis ATCC 33320]